MKVCVLSDQYSVRASGIGLYTRNLVDSLVRKGFDVTLMCKEPKPKGAKFNYVHVPTNGIDPTHGKWWSLAKNAAKMILDVHEKYRFDIFHSADARQGALAAAKLKPLGVPTVGNMNDYYYADSPLNPFYFIREYKVDGLKRFFYNHFTRYFEKRHLKSFDIIIANSQVTKDTIAKAYGLKRVIKIYKALDKLQNKRKPVKAKGPFTVSLVGVNLQRKGIFYLIKAAPDVLNKFPGTRFEILGKYDRKMVEECRKLGVEKSFVFHSISPPDKVSELYRRSDIFILPSLIEGLGVVMIEAMSYGLPCIGSHTGGIKELIKDGETGLSIRPGNSSDISSALVRMMSDRKLRERLSKGAFIFSKNFNFEHLLEKTLKVYRKLSSS